MGRDDMSGFSVDLPDGACLAVQEAGSGETVLLVSGLGGTANFWQPIIARLPGKHCISFDQRGVAGSTRGKASVNIAQLAADAWAVLDVRNVECAHLVGHSTGGCIVQEMALMRPERVGSLVLGGTWPGPSVYMQALFAMREALLNASPWLYEQNGTFLSYPAQWLIEHPKVLAQQGVKWSDERVDVVRERIAALLAYDQRGALDAVKVPALVMGASDDQVVPHILQQELSRLLSNATLLSLESGGHFFPVVRSADYAKALLEWFQAHPL